jgi:GNAT superfamily N-acetyltransferase
MSKRSFMRVSLAASESGRMAGVRTFVPNDVPALGELMYRSYLGTVDYEGETPEQTVEEVRKTVRGEYGEFVPQCSKVVVESASLVSAALVTRFQERPFVAFTFTDPAFAGRGLARACMRAAMNELFAQGETELRLVVTLANLPAVRLYTMLGFEFEHSDA